MPHVVLSHTASPRTSPGPRNAVPQDTGRLHEHSRYAQPIAGVPAPRRCSTSRRYSGTQSVFRHTVGTPARSLSVLRPIVGAPAHLSVPTAYCRCSQPIVGKRFGQAVRTAHCREEIQVSGTHSLLSVLRPMVSPQAHCRDSGSLSMLRHIVGAHTEKTEDRRPAPRYTLPNKGVQATANKLRSCVAPLVRRA